MPVGTTHSICAVSPQQTDAVHKANTHTTLVHAVLFRVRHLTTKRPYFVSLSQSCQYSSVYCPPLARCTLGRGDEASNTTAQAALCRHTADGRPKLLLLLLLLSTIRLTEVTSPQNKRAPPKVPHYACAYVTYTYIRPRHSRTLSVDVSILSFMLHHNH